MNVLRCPCRNKRLVSSSAGASWDKPLSGQGIIAWGLSTALLEALHLFTGTGIHHTRWLLPLTLLGTLLVKLEEASRWPLCERSWWELSSLYPTCLRHQWEQPIGQVMQIFHTCSFLAFSIHFQKIWWSPRVTLRPGHLTLPKYCWHLPNGDSQLGVTWDHLQKLCKDSLRTVPTCVSSCAPSCVESMCYFCLYCTCSAAKSIEKYSLQGLGISRERRHKEVQKGGL